MAESLNELRRRALSGRDASQPDATFEEVLAFKLGEPTFDEELAHRLSEMKIREAQEEQDFQAALEERMEKQAAGRDRAEGSMLRTMRKQELAEDPLKAAMMPLPQPATSPMSTADTGPTPATPPVTDPHAAQVDTPAKYEAHYGRKKGNAAIDLLKRSGATVLEWGRGAVSAKKAVEDLVHDLLPEEGLKPGMPKKRHIAESSRVRPQYDVWDPRKISFWDNAKEKMDEIVGKSSPHIADPTHPLDINKLYDFVGAQLPQLAITYGTAAQLGRYSLMLFGAAAGAQRASETEREGGTPLTILGKAAGTTLVETVSEALPFLNWLETVGTPAIKLLGKGFLGRLGSVGKAGAIQFVMEGTEEVVAEGGNAVVDALFDRDGGKSVLEKIAEHVAKGDYLSAMFVGGMMGFVLGVGAAGINIPSLKTIESKVTFGGGKNKFEMVPLEGKLEVGKVGFVQTRSGVEAAQVQLILPGKAVLMQPLTEKPHGPVWVKEGEIYVPGEDVSFTVETPEWLTHTTEAGVEIGPEDQDARAKWLEDKVKGTPTEEVRTKQLARKVKTLPGEVQPDRENFTEQVAAAFKGMSVEDASYSLNLIEAWAEHGGVTVNEWLVGNIGAFQYGGKSKSAMARHEYIFDYKSIVKGFISQDWTGKPLEANVKNLVHELGHVMEMDLRITRPADFERLAKWVVGHGRLTLALDEDRFWSTKKAKELIAQGMSAFVATGKAPTPELQPAFSHMASFIATTAKNFGKTAEEYTNSYGYKDFTPNAQLFQLLSELFGGEGKEWSFAKPLPIKKSAHVRADGMGKVKAQKHFGASQKPGQVDLGALDKESKRVPQLEMLDAKGPQPEGPVYHGTGAKYDVKKANLTWYDKQRGTGYYTTEGKKEAEGYAVSNLTPQQMAESKLKALSDKDIKAVANNAIAEIENHTDAIKASPNLMASIGQGKTSWATVLERLKKLSETGSIENTYNELDGTTTRHLLQAMNRAIDAGTIENPVAKGEVKHLAFTGKGDFLDVDQLIGMEDAEGIVAAAEKILPIDTFEDTKRVLAAAFAEEHIPFDPSSTRDVTQAALRSVAEAKFSEMADFLSGTISATQVLRIMNTAGFAGFFHTSKVSGQRQWIFLRPRSQLREVGEELGDAPPREPEWAVHASETYLADDGYVENPSYGNIPKDLPNPTAWENANKALTGVIDKLGATMVPEAVKSRWRKVMGDTFGFLPELRGRAIERDRQEVEVRFTAEEAAAAFAEVNPSKEEVDMLDMYLRQYMMPLHAGQVALPPEMANPTGYRALEKLRAFSQKIGDLRLDAGLAVIKSIMNSENGSGHYPGAYKKTEAHKGEVMMGGKVVRVYGKSMDLSRKGSKEMTGAATLMKWHIRVGRHGKLVGGHGFDSKAEAVEVANEYMKEHGTKVQIIEPRTHAEALLFGLITDPQYNIKSVMKRKGLQATHASFVVDAAKTLDDAGMIAEEDPGDGSMMQTPRLNILDSLVKSGQKNVEELKKLQTGWVDKRFGEAMLAQYGESQKTPIRWVENLLKSTFTTWNPTRYPITALPGIQEALAAFHKFTGLEIPVGLATRFTGMAMLENQAYIGTFHPKCFLSLAFHKNLIDSFNSLSRGKEIQDEFYRELEAFGVPDDSFVPWRVEAEDALDKGLYKKFRDHRLQVYSAIDMSHKYALYRWLRERGMTKEDAFKEMDHTLFNFGNVPLFWRKMSAPHPWIPGVPILPVVIYNTIKIHAYQAHKRPLNYAIGMAVAGMGMYGLKELMGSILGIDDEELERLESVGQGIGMLEVPIGRDSRGVPITVSPQNLVVPFANLHNIATAGFKGQPLTERAIQGLFSVLPVTARAVISTFSERTGFGGKEGKMRKRHNVVAKLNEGLLGGYLERETVAMGNRLAESHYWVAIMNKAIRNDQLLDKRSLTSLLYLEPMVGMRRRSTMPEMEGMTLGVMRAQISQIERDLHSLGYRRPDPRMARSMNDKSLAKDRADLIRRHKKLVGAFLEKRDAIHAAKQRR